MQTNNVPTGFPWDPTEFLQNMERDLRKSGINIDLTSASIDSNKITVMNSVRPDAVWQYAVTGDGKVIINGNEKYNDARLFREDDGEDEIVNEKQTEETEYERRILKPVDFRGMPVDYTSTFENFTSYHKYDKPIAGSFIPYRYGYIFSNKIHGFATKRDYSKYFRFAQKNYSGALLVDVDENGEIFNIVDESTKQKPTNLKAVLLLLLGAAAVGIAGQIGMIYAVVKMILGG